jgi:hypothetical protein
VRGRCQVLVVALAVAGCGGSGSPNPAKSSPAVALPSGALASLVPQPGEVDAGLVPLLAQTGPADADRLASFSSDVPAAKTRLVQHGLEAAYVASYADPASGRTLVTVVARFVDEAGARKDLVDDAAGSTPTDLSEGSVERVQPLPGSATGQLVTERARSGRTTLLVAVGAPGKVDTTSVRAIARQLLARAG